MSLFFCCCTNNTKETLQMSVEKEINIDFEDVVIADFSKIIEVESLIPLNVSNELPIGTFDKILFAKDHIVILDKITESIYIFNKKGDLFSKISKKGKGPNEYASIKDISITSPNIINVVDNKLRSIKKYTFNGEFIESIRTEGWPDSFFENKSYKYLSVYSTYLTKKDKNYYLNIEKGANDSKGYFPFKQSIFSARKNRDIFLSDGKGQLFYRRHYDDNIYRLKGDKINLAFKIDFGKKSYPTKDLYDATSLDRFNKVLKKKEYVGNIFNIHITDNHLFFNYNISKKQVNTYISDLKTNKNTHYTYAKPNNEDISFTPVSSDGFYFYSLLECNELPESSLVKINKKYNMKLVKGSNTSILVKYRYK